MANFCTQCGSPISGGAKFCTACGTPVAAAGIAHSMAAPPVKVQPVYQQPPPTPQPVYQQPAPMPQPVHQQPAPMSQSVYQQPTPMSQPMYQQPTPTPQPVHQQPAPMPQPMHQQPQYGRNVPPRYAWPVPQKKKKGFLPLFLLIWAGLLGLGWYWVPDAVKDARLPIVPVVSEKEITAEQLEEYAAIDARVEAGTPASTEETDEPDSRHIWPVWLYGEKPGEAGEK